MKEFLIKGLSIKGLLNYTKINSKLAAFKGSNNTEFKWSYSIDATTYDISFVIRIEGDVPKGFVRDRKFTMTYYCMSHLEDLSQSILDDVEEYVNNYIKGCELMRKTELERAIKCAGEALTSVQDLRDKKYSDKLNTTYINLENSLVELKSIYQSKYGEESKE